MLRRHLEDMAILGPDIEAASHSTVSANRLRLADTVFTHGFFGFGELKDRSEPGFRFNALDHLNQSG